MKCVKKKDELWFPFEFRGLFRSERGNSSVMMDRRPATTLSARRVVPRWTSGLAIAVATMTMTIIIMVIFETTIAYAHNSDAIGGITHLWIIGIIALLRIIIFLRGGNIRLLWIRKGNGSVAITRNVVDNRTLYATRCAKKSECSNT